MKIKGLYGEAVVYTDNIDSKAQLQLQNFLNREEFKNSNVRVMPDVHAGAGCVIGFTARLLDKVIPNIVGVDIGCGMEVTNLGRVNIDFSKLDEYIRKDIPHGFAVNKKPVQWCDKLKANVEKISGKIGTSFQRDLNSLGSLGGGNHFIEIAKGKSKDKYLVIHSGSRNFGLKVAEYHQKRAKKMCSDKVKNNNLPQELAYLMGDYKNEYLKDMQVAIDFANLSRKIMSKKIVNFLGLTYEECEKFTTIHNYISLQDNIIRKGAISAHLNEKVIIPLNMRDGSLIAIGKGNAEWNKSAPHGAGRVLSRRAAKDKLSVNEFKQVMKGIFTSSVGKKTLDESPMAYKNVADIIGNISETVNIVDHIKPLYNFKAH